MLHTRQNGRAALALLGFALGCTENELDTLEPELSVTPAALSFEDLVLGEATSLSLTLSNTGRAPLHLDMSVDSPFLAELPEEVLDKGASMALELVFPAEAAGDFSGALTLLSDDPEQPELAVPLTASLGAPALQLEPEALQLRADGEPQEEVLYLSNRGAGPLRILGLSQEGDGDFLVSGLDEGALLAPDAAQVLTVRFQGEEDASAVLHVSSNDPDTPDAQVLLEATTPLSVRITEPLAATTWTLADPQRFVAEVRGAQGAVELVWTDGQGLEEPQSLGGDGEAVLTPSLDVGLHEVRVLVEDAEGQTAEASVTVELRCNDWSAVCCEPDPFTAPAPGDEGLPEEGLTLWLRMDLGLGVDAELGACTLSDLSGDGHDFSTEAGRRPSVLGELGGQPALSFDGVDDYFYRYDDMDIPDTSGRSFFAVYRTNDLNSRQAIVFQGDPSTNWRHVGLELNSWQTRGQRYGAYLSAHSFDSTQSLDTQAHLLATVFETLEYGNPVADVITLRVDGQVAAIENAYATNWIVSDMNGMNSSGVCQSGCDGELAEVLVYSRALSDAEVEQVETYLLLRYGL